MGGEGNLGIWFEMVLLRLRLKSRMYQRRMTRTASRKRVEGMAIPIASFSP